MFKQKLYLLHRLMTEKDLVKNLKGTARDGLWQTKERRDTKLCTENKRSLKQNRRQGTK